jgi:2-polyprenyl-3-methyl-5-hydroxy-6-metoxy-1,4-benzoquinol methylase
MNDMETTHYFDRLAGQWSDRYARSQHFRQRLDTVLGWVDREPLGCSILDFGCGSGVMVRALVERSFSVTGVDGSSGMIAAAQRHLRRAPADRCHLECIDGEGYDGAYARRTYHGVLCVAVLEYVRAPEALLGHVAALTEAGGFLILSVPNQTSVLRKIEWFLHQHPRLQRRAAALAGLAGSNDYLHLQTQQFTRNAIDRPLRELGFVLEEMRYLVSPSVLRVVENNRRIGMNMMFKYRKRIHPGLGP